MPHVANRYRYAQVAKEMLQYLLTHRPCTAEGWALYDRVFRGLADHERGHMGMEEDMVGPRGRVGQSARGRGRGEGGGLAGNSAQELKAGKVERARVFGCCWQTANARQDSKRLVDSTFRPGKSCAIGWGMERPYFLGV